MEIGVQKQTDEEKQVQKGQFNKLNDSGDKRQTGYCGFLTVEYYTPYFNVTENDVIQRVKATFLPFRPDFLNITKDNPDLWGPIWINATLIFMITAIANLRQVDSEKENQSFDVGYVPQATALLYIIAFGTPAILAVVMKVLGVDLSFFQTICLYGYSMSTLLPITILCYFQNELFLWLIITYGVGNSILFLIFNLKEELDKLQIQKKYIIIAIVVTMQLSLYLFYKLVFFSYVSEGNVETTTTSASSEPKEPAN
ncbi:unnamed protein product (macronuclear) [Paramecium tetraurelia]|uniref:Protein YIPF n=1 Tax=Paramecium tetraurelia TaxID=5888 RepID=A0CYZ1_PARTE|nr:uncharacterized protein GSPATT00011609001 [Paramecium tetraurelia]CAK76008.1 unnamed protein product [Paramecium tetraurelia]|eukprot:XP_001443405.1 hypothetical protein (macronuclear) [Paramecium tetraurelia strain d4-2]